WLPPNNASNYAFGWSTGTDQGTPVVAKDGAQTGSRAYIRMYPEKGYVIVLLSNQRQHDLPSLGRQIGTLLLDAENAMTAAGVMPIQPIADSLIAADDAEGEDEVVGSLGRLHLVLPITTKPVTPIRAVPGADLGENQEDELQIENPIVDQPPVVNGAQSIFLPLVTK
ncbi:MAG: hypothetical protein NT075_31960, partial [Chloroflexi bacterium]|nr:hypothetical protein [Chloroflexota bacterium]